MVTIKVNIYCDNVIKRNNALFSNGNGYLYAVVHSSRKLFGSGTGTLYGGGGKLKNSQINIKLKFDTCISVWSIKPKYGSFSPFV